MIIDNRAKWVAHLAGESTIGVGGRPRAEGSHEISWAAARPGSTGVVRTPHLPGSCATV